MQTGLLTNILIFQSFSALNLISFGLKKVNDQM